MPKQLCPKCNRQMHPRYEPDNPRRLYLELKTFICPYGHTKVVKVEGV